MTVLLTDPGNGGLFDILGKAFYAIGVLNTATLTTIPTEIEDFLDEWNGLPGVDLDYQTLIDKIPSATESWQSSAAGLSTAVQASCSGLVIQMVNDDDPQPDRKLKTALEVLIAQMEDSSSYVDPSVVALSLAANTDNDNDLVIAYSSKRGDGREQENMLGEAVAITVTRENSDTPTIRLRGGVAEKNGLSYLWPQGSGANRTITATEASSSLLSNGNFETTTMDDTPDDWVIKVGTVSTTIAVTDPEIQTIIVSGTPSGGLYTLRWTNSDSITRTTDNLVYNAGGSAVQSALRSLPGLERITVTTSGDTPNYTHTVTFTGLAGVLSELTSVNALTGGTGASIAHNTTSDGDDGAFKGRALQLISDGTGELTSLVQSISGLAAETVYFCHFRIKRVTPDDETSQSSSSSASQSSFSDSSSTSSSSTEAESTSSTEASVTSSSSPSPSSQSASSSTEAESETSTQSASESSSTVASESSSQSASESSSSSADLYELRVEIIDGIDGDRTVDGQGNDNEIRVDLDAVSSDSHDSKSFSFRLQRSVASPVYLRIRLMRQLPRYDVVYIDEMAVVKGTELYSGGPYVSVFSGVNDVSLDDTWTLTSTTDRAGEFQEWYNRTFAMAAKGLLLPSTGDTNIPDSLIS